MDPHHFDADPDADPDSTYHPDADPDPRFQIKAQPNEKALKYAHISSLGRYVFGSEISYNKPPPRLPGLAY